MKIGYKKKGDSRLVVSPVFIIGAPGWDRTNDSQLRRLVLYPLSYGRIDICRG